LFPGKELLPEPLHFFLHLVQGTIGIYDHISMFYALLRRELRADTG
jgi:hypothetical protein